MPGLKHLPQYERHLTLASLYHCPRDYWYVAQMRAGKLAEDPTNEGLLVGVLVHAGLGALWRQRQEQANRLANGFGARVWQPSLALDAIDRAPELAYSCKPGAAPLTPLGEQVVKEAKKAVAEYAAQWTGARDHWQPIYIEDTNETVAEPWRLLGERFVAYPDLIVGNGMSTHVVDYKTSKWKFDARKWEYHPELLTQCVAAKQLTGGPVTYQVDFLQRPNKYSTVWGMPTTPVWEFTKEKERLAWSWVREGLERMDELSTQHGSVISQLPYTHPWPQALTCETPWGVCKHYERCFRPAE